LQQDVKTKQEKKQQKTFYAVINFPVLF